MTDIEWQNMLQDIPTKSKEALKKELKATDRRLKKLDKRLAGFQPKPYNIRLKLWLNSPRWNMILSPVRRNAIKTLDDKNE